MLKNQPFVDEICESTYTQTNKEFRQYSYHGFLGKDIVNAIFSALNES